ncbi:MAG: hypothetical protein LW832_10470 [Parachlamydia sp.]|jgi:hypothetical protein|nr:hypothetical protein [Parachlamydia sp.]
MNAPPTGYGFTGSQYSPDYSDPNTPEKSGQMTNTSVKQGNPINPGVILTKDSLEVPLEVQFGINNEQSGASRPSLLPLFRTRYVEDSQTEDLTLTHYQERLNSLPLELQQRLNLDKSKPLEDRDPDLVALDESLHFESNLLALAAKISISNEDPNLVIRAQQYLAFPDHVKKELLAYANSVTNFLDDHLASIGPNDPAYDLFLGVSNQLKEAMTLFKTG